MILKRERSESYIWFWKKKERCDGKIFQYFKKVITATLTKMSLNVLKFNFRTFQSFKKCLSKKKLNSGLAGFITPVSGHVC